MIRGLYRKTHFVLAVGSALFLSIASISGFFLGVEALLDHSKNYTFSDLDEVKLQDHINALETHFDEIYDIQKTTKNALIVEGELNNTFSRVYVHPITGNPLGKVGSPFPFFTFMRGLHRSLFLKETGRIIVGAVAFLLMLLSLSGLLLLFQRLGGLLQFFKFTRDQNKFRQWHINSGKWLFLPIFLVAISGAYLTGERFDLFIHQADANRSSIYKAETIDLQKISLDEFHQITYPFTNDPDDTFQVVLSTKKIQYRNSDKSIVKEELLDYSQLLKGEMYKLHTGESNWGIALILTFTAIGIVLFLISGFKLTTKASWKIFSVSINSLKSAEILIFYGSETGNTYRFAKAFKKQLKTAGYSVGLTTLNRFQIHKKTEKIILMASNYGDGEAPYNANLSPNKIKNSKLQRPVQYAVLGFGSTQYPKYCHFAKQLDQHLAAHKDFSPLLPLYKVNNQSKEAYDQWENLIHKQIKAKG